MPTTTSWSLVPKKVLQYTNHYRLRSDERPAAEFSPEEGSLLAPTST